MFHALTPLPLPLSLNRADRKAVDAAPPLSEAYLASGGGAAEDKE